jgi:hypothetical protein
MFVDFLYELRARKVPVGTTEAVALARALSSELHGSSLDGFYHVARALLIHSEAYLDDFDQVFAHHFRGVALDAKKIAEDLLDWLKNPIQMRELSDEERDGIEKLDLEEVLKQFEERLKQQKERHDGGNRWIGTGGTSPFGTGGENPNGLSVGSSGGGKGGAMRTADARKYKQYRSDLFLDIRQIEVALRKLRAFAREGSDRELDIESTIDATAKDGGELTIVTRPPRRPNTRVILMMDVGGTMDPYAQLMSQVFSAAKRATHWRELQTYYFHNAIYGKVYKTEGFSDPIPIKDIIHQCGKHYKLIMIGDASMAPYELLGSPGYGEDGRIPAIAWFMALREHFERSVWLNPDKVGDYSHPTVDAIGSVFPMFSLTLEGLGQAVSELVRGGKRAA